MYGKLIFSILVARILKFYDLIPWWSCRNDANNAVYPDTNWIRIHPIWLTRWLHGGYCGFRIRIRISTYTDPHHWFGSSLVAKVPVLQYVYLNTVEQCLGSIFIESGSSRKSQSGSRKALNPNPDPSYFFTLSEKKT